MVFRYAVWVASKYLAMRLILSGQFIGAEEARAAGLVAEVAPAGETVERTLDLAAAALGYAVWWVTAIGQEELQDEFKPLLGVPDDLSIIDIMCFGPPLKPSYKR